MNYFTEKNISLAIILLLFCTCASYAQNPLTPANLPAGKSGDGLKGQYFNDPQLGWKTLFRIDPQINFDWSYGSPDLTVKKDQFSARWTGQLYAPAAGNYTFTITADDGVRLWVDGKLLIDQWHQANSMKYTGKLHLEGRKFYNIKLEYYENQFHAVLKLFWQFENYPQALIPQQFLFSEPQHDPQTTLVRHQERRTPARTGTNEPASPVRTANTPAVTELPAPPAQKPKGEVFTDLQINQPVILKNLRFDQGTYDLRQESSFELDKLANTLLQNPTLKIEIAGHTDNIGDPAKNLELSERRAQTVKEYLVKKGVSSGRIAAIGYGGSKPIASNSFEQTRKKNRRVEFVVK